MNKAKSSRIAEANSVRAQVGAWIVGARIVGPNLGCPEIVSLTTINERGLRVIIAAPVSETFEAAGYSLKARPSSVAQSRESGDGESANHESDGLSFALQITCAKKLEAEALPDRFDDLSDTRLLISTTLRTELFPEHAFWNVCARPETPLDEKYFRKAKGTPRSTLYDLSLSVQGNEVGGVKHALCLRPEEAGVQFVHLTDLHAAARNDLWESEVPAVIVGSPVTPGRQDFKNFNNRVRKFIRWANREADEGRLDFVLVLGDLVDFGRTGLFDRTADDSNWSTVVAILTGSPAERRRGNPGFRVPIFTTTGNHDWRTYPYSPKYRIDIFGITKKCADELDFWYRNTATEIGQKLEEVEQNLIRKGSPLLARSWWGAITSMGLRGITVGLTRLQQRASAVLVKNGKQLWWALAAVVFGINGAPHLKEILENGPWALLARMWFVVRHPSFAGLSHHPGLIVTAVFFLLALIFTLIAPSFLYARLRVMLESLIAIEAEVGTIHEYFLRVNPYFNYAFHVGSCDFILLDTGPDCLTAQSFWDDGGKKVRRISINDNILGGSPDSM
ncbi:MAG TPA: metallophosphoesterase, partial [Candidatus Acidoferrum sp.]|nr:metallophosphoesterase [Candidatus Acidoferrum sp.]